MPRVLLIVPGGTYRAAAFLDAAARLGVEVVIASDETQALAEVMGERFLEVALARPERAGAAIAALGQRLPLDAVLAVDDEGALAAAFGAEALGLGQNSPAAIAATRDKSVMRAAFARAGVAQPDYAVVGPTRRAAAVLRAARRIGYPCVVKPSCLSASRGVIRVDDDAQARAAVARIEAILAEVDRSGAPVLVERFVPGDEVALEGMLSEGTLEVLSLFDKPDPLDGPYFEETIYVTPSRHPAALQDAITETVQAACAALGLRDGPIHAEARLPAEDPNASGGAPVVMLEVAARTIGGRCAAALSFSRGRSLEELVLAHALDHRFGDGVTPDGASAVMMLPIPRSGVLAGVAHQDEARAVEFITALDVTTPPGRSVRAAPESDRYLGFLFSRAPSPELAEAALREAHARLEVRIDTAELVGA